MKHLETLLDDSVKVVSLQYASNVTGAVHPLEEVRHLIGKERLFFVDATQMVLHTPLDMR
jgi:selenocysteine lyase/cysteine desulfurase